MKENNKKYPPIRQNRRQKIMNIVYLAVILVVFEIICLMFLIFPRTKKSVLEQRELAEFPELTTKSWFSGEYSRELGEWYSDTVPFRDTLTTLSTSLREYKGFRHNDIVLHNVVKPITTDTPPSVPDTSPVPSKEEKDETQTVTETVQSTEETKTEEPAESVPQTTTAPENHEIAPVENDNIPEDDAVNITNNGIAVIGSGANTRALMLYGGSYTVGESYAKVINKYKELLGENVNVYSMVIPTAVEFYAPEQLKPYTGSQLDNINNIISFLSPDVRAVDVYTALASHTDEYIYTRTDHHWAALGAYYAAEQFAAAAGVPFMDISDYTQHVIHDYVGTMYMYSEDIALRNNPEDFFYYVPNNIDYTCTYYNYNLDSNGKISGMADPIQADFFQKYGDGNSMAYCTYMGGDAKIVHVNTSTKNGRRLAIFKDSYGNAIPPYLFGSFEDIYVIDMRYFTYNAIDYLTEKGITDVLFANNAFHAATASTVTYYENFLTQ